jgi:hypothetical protein
MVVRSSSWWWLAAPAFLAMWVPGAFAQYRTIDGTDNNLTYPEEEWGAAGIPLLRVMDNEYGDDLSMPAGSTRPSARACSNAACDQATSVPNGVGATDMVWQWGQFLDHDISLTGGAEPLEAFHIAVPLGDPFFDPFSTGTEQIFFGRSVYEPTTLPRQQLNEITAFIDASNVYGSDPVRASALRTNDGTGRLNMSRHRLLPFNEEGLPNAGGPDPTFHLAGDVRANEQIGLTALHTLFVREHNRLAAIIWEENPSLSGEEIYQRARAIVGAQIQVITYNEFLPILLGPGAIGTWTNYDPMVNPGIINMFSTAAYRFGHSMLSSTLLRLKRNGHSIPTGDIALRDAFFAPAQLQPSLGKGIEPLLRGLTTQTAQDIDLLIVDDVRNFLFGPPGAGGFDLASLNMQRGRDHGLPAYNQVRVEFGRPAAVVFADISSDAGIQQRLADAYDSVDDIDLWVGGLAENHAPGALVGPLFHAIISEQFTALRDGDRFWYENVLSPEEIEEVENTTLADIIRRNTKIEDEIQDSVFLIETVD